MNKIIIRRKGGRMRRREKGRGEEEMQKVKEIMSIGTECWSC